MKKIKLILLICFICTIIVGVKSNNALAQIKDSSTTITKITLPLAENGLQDLRYESNTVVLNDLKANYIKNLLSGKSYSQEEALTTPQTYVGIDIKNVGPNENVYLLKLLLRDKGDSKNLPGLYMPSAEGTMEIGTEHEVKSLIRVKAYENKRVLVPLYFDENKVVKGEYVLKVELLLNDKKVSAIGNKIIVEKSNDFGFVIIAVAMFLIILGIIRAFFKAKKTLKELRTKDYIVIAMLAVVSFVLTSIPGSLLWGLVHIFLGPFASLVTGLFTSVFSAALVVCLLVLIPKKGVYTLYVIAHFFLAALILGRMNLISILTMGISCILIEYLLNRTGALKSVKKDKISFYFLFIFALVEGLVGWINLEITMVLYRLYYANWYIWQNVLICGMFYSYLGAQLGVKIGRLLKKLHSD